MSEENPTPEEKVARVAMKPEQLEKLPKWVQDHLSYIYSDLRRAYESIDAINGDIETEYSAVLDYGRTTTQDTRQKIKSTFGIEITPKGRRTALYNVRFHEGQLEIRGVGNPSQLVTYMPSGNVVNVVALDSPYMLRSTQYDMLPKSDLS